MEEENKNLDQKLAETIDNKLEYTFIDKFLVKELEPTMIEVKVKKPIPSEKQEGKDENGIEAVDFDKTEEVTETVAAKYKKGVVLKVPTKYIDTYNAQIEASKTDTIATQMINVGDTIVYKWSEDFDLFKDSKIVSVYDIVAICK